ncbi:ATP-binding protein [Demequina mangrovi]|uniref:ATP-binding protein n=1 Tax=Demequina mangrovi TaxID=1043493 RepID=UPI000A5EE738|nr:LuxR family transcriptional regulator [Demequina mangrovi]
MLVARERELSTLVDALDAGADGAPSAVIVRGEAGIGKSRLVRELLDRARAMPDTVIATGTCVESGPVGAPYGAVRRLLHELALEVGVDALGDAAGSPRVRATLARLVPELDDGADAPPATGVDYVAEAVERVLERLSVDHHLVLVLEDLHWADDATRGLVRTLGATLRGSRLTLLLTYRADDVRTGHPLRATVAELERNRAISTVDVGRLDRHEVAEQIRRLTGAEPDAATVHAIEERSEGVPLFVEELVLSPDARLTGTLEDIVLARYERLGTAARAVARLLSVAADGVDEELLARAWAGRPADFRRGLEEALGAGAIRADGTALAFHHALLREAVQATLMPRERATAHARLALLLQGLVDDGRRDLAAGAAHHWRAAGEPGRAFDATVLALAGARAQYAMASAARLGEQLLELWDEVPDPEARADASALAIRCRIAEDLRDSGQMHAAMRAIDAALATAPERGAELERARLHAAAMSLASEHVGAAAAAVHVEPIETLLRGRTDAAALPYLVQARALSAHLVDRVTAMRVSDEVVDLAATSGDPSILSMALCKRSTVRARDGEYEAALADLDHALAIDEGAMLWGRCATANIVDTLNRLGRYDDAVEAGESAITDAIDVGLERRIGAPITANVAEALVNAGRLDEALVHVRRASTLLRGESPRWECFLLEIEAVAALWDGHLDRAAELLAAEAPLLPDPEDDAEGAFNAAALTVDLALARRAAAPPAEASRLLDDASRAAAMLLHPEAVRDPSAAAMLLLATCRAIAAARAARVPDDAALVDRAVALRDTQPDHPATAHVRALVDALLAGPDDVDRWRRAVDACGAGRSPRRLVHESRLRLALALRRAGDRRTAETMLAEVARDAGADGASLVGGWAAAALVRREETRSPLDSLTSREQEVLALVAGGLTNPQIGARLHIAPKTASVHVSAILAKVGAANRAEAAAWFSEHGRR